MLQLFWWVCSAEALHNEEKKTKNKLQSLLKVLQSLLHLPEQEQFVKTSAFLHERVSKLQVTHAL